MPPIDDLKCMVERCDGGIKDFERPHCMNGVELPSCPKCGNEMEIDWTAKKGTFQLKGGGWPGKSFKKGGH